MKTRHQLAFAEVEKLRKSAASDEGAEQNNEGEDDDVDEDLEARASVILMASFCEDLPQEAVPEISLDDQIPIGRHIEKVTTEYARRQGRPQPPKKGKPRPSIPSRR
ncbi:hypothetical protein [Oligoflexus tunisiensis]|uniref:hypothetical protein n=1 Tax=Oligoflexus tunisiensis TaxID=708132 RepID=UPI001C406687|nr:hypothetical protein [Oligoflexus tunisiensis]